ncbi:MAG: hypothetical protein H8E55_02145 [Pelagibacterales bacterium]|nr:hypothetical protein [Pelagibacterales bacterium]
MDVSTLPILPPVKDRIPGQYYNYKGEYRRWDGNNLINRDIINNNRRKRRKENYEKYRKKTKKYMENPINKLRANIGSRMKRIIDNNINCEELLGCSWSFLVKYIEEQFEKQTAKYGVNKYTGEAMSWDNYGMGNNCFNIDHIKPYREYDMNNLDERKMVCVYTNIQPLWSYDNVLKDCR